MAREGIVVAFVMMLVVGGVLLLSSFYSVDQTEQAIILRFGKIQDVTGAGLHMKAPLIDKVVKYQITQKNLDMTGGNSMTVLTSDGLDAQFDLSVIFRITDPEKIYSEIGKNYGAFLMAKVRGVTRSEVAKYSAEDLYTDARDTLEAQILENLRLRMGDHFVVEDVLIRDVALPGVVSTAIQNKMKALQESQQAEYELEKARIVAQKRVVEAEAEAEAIVKVRKELTKDYLTYEYITQIAQSDNSKIYVVPQDVNMLIGGVGQ